jgi:hypothetical protein
MGFKEACQQSCSVTTRWLQTRVIDIATVAIHLLTYMRVMAGLNVQR